MTWEIPDGFGEPKIKPSEKIDPDEYHNLLEYL